MRGENIIPEGAEGNCKTQKFGGDCIVRFWEFGYENDVRNMLCITSAATE